LYDLVAPDEETPKPLVALLPQWLRSFFIRPLLSKSKRLFSHPIVANTAKSIRHGMREFLLQSAYTARQSNILFVCGGKEHESARHRFRRYAEEHLADYRVYFPEDSFENLFELEGDGAKFVNLSEFESTVAELSCCVIIFPEAAGSLVELGMFSAMDDIVKKMLVVIDRRHENGSDSFISLAPVNVVNEKSDFKPVIYDDYNDAELFERLKRRIKSRHRISSRHQKVDFAEKEWTELTYFQKLSVVHWIVDILRVCDVGNVKFVAKSIFGNTVKYSEIVDICSILAGSEEFSIFGEEKLLRVSGSFSKIIDTKSNEEGIFRELKMGVISHCIEEQEFCDLLEAAYQ